jgi:hypothetical protein
MAIIINYWLQVIFNYPYYIFRLESLTKYDRSHMTPERLTIFLLIVARYPDKQAALLLL